MSEKEPQFCIKQIIQNCLTSIENKDQESMGKLASHLLYFLCYSDDFKLSISNNPNIFSDEFEAAENVALSLFKWASERQDSALCITALNIIQVISATENSKTSMHKIRNVVADADDQFGSYADQENLISVNFSELLRELRKSIHQDWDCKKALRMIKELKDYSEIKSEESSILCGYFLNLSSNQKKRIFEDGAILSLFEIEEPLKQLVGFTETPDLIQELQLHIKTGEDLGIDFPTSLSEDEIAVSLLANTCNKILSAKTYTEKEPEKIRCALRIILILRKYILLEASALLNKSFLKIEERNTENAWKLVNDLASVIPNFQLSQNHKRDCAPDIDFLSTLSRRCIVLCKDLSDAEGVKMINDIIKTSPETILLKLLERINEYQRKVMSENHLNNIKGLNSLVFRFGTGSRISESNVSKMGKKGASLCGLSHEVDKFPPSDVVTFEVPPGFGLSTLTENYLQRENLAITDLETPLKKEIKTLEKITKKRLGSAKNPLLLVIRSGAAISLPGLLPTISHVGLNLSIVEEWASHLDVPEMAYRSYLRFLMEYAKEVAEISSSQLSSYLQKELKQADIRPNFLYSMGLKNTRLAVLSLLKLLENTQNLPPENPEEQVTLLTNFILQRFKKPDIQERWLQEGGDNYSGTACLIEECCGIESLKDLSGVILSRDVRTGKPGILLEYTNQFGADVVDGAIKPCAVENFKKDHPEIFSQLSAFVSSLEKQLKIPLDIEFALRFRADKKPSLYLVQRRRLPLPPNATRRALWDFYQEGKISAEELKEKLDKAPDSGNISYLSEKILSDAELVASGIGIGEEIVQGRLFSRADAAIDSESPVIFLSSENVPADLYSDDQSKVSGYITSEGGQTAHAAIVALKQNKSCVSGITWSKPESGTIHITQNNGATFSLNTGDWVTIIPKTGSIFKGKLPIEYGKAENDEILHQRLLETVNNL